MKVEGQISLSAFARRLGVSAEAVSKAVKSGRLVGSVGRTAKGSPVIVDVSLADREWVENARKAKPLTLVKKTVAASPAPAAEPPASTDAHNGDPAGEQPISDPVQLSLIKTAEADRRVTIEKLKKIEMENAVARGDLLLKAQVFKEAFEADRILRQNMLNVPVRIAGQLAAESDPARVQALLDTALREALGATADAYLEAAHG